MAGKKITEAGGRGLYIPGNDIDTDQLIPARYLKEITFNEMGNWFFQDARYELDGKTKKRHPITGIHPLDDPRFDGASVLLGDENWGCGSSREHALQAMFRAGFYSMVAKSYAEIFFGNGIANGIVLVTALPDDIAKIVTAIRDNPQIHINIDLDTMVAKYGSNSVNVMMPDSSRKALAEGMYDPVEVMLDAKAKIIETAERQPYMSGYKKD